MRISRRTKAPRTLAALALLFTFALAHAAEARTPASAARASRPKSRAVRLYFGNERLQKNRDECGEVFAVRRSVASTPSVAADTLRQLFRGPTRAERRRGYHSWFGAKTADALISVRLRRGSAYVNLRDVSLAISGASSSCGSAQFFAEVERTLRQFPSVRRVFYAFEGDPARFYEWMQLECPEELTSCSPAPFRDE